MKKTLVLVVTLALLLFSGCGEKKLKPQDVAKKLSDKGYFAMTAFESGTKTYFLTETECVSSTFQKRDCPLSIDDDGVIFVLINDDVMGKYKAVTVTALDGDTLIMSYYTPEIDTSHVFYSTLSQSTIVEDENSKNNFKEWLADFEITEKDVIEYIKWYITNFSEPLRAKLPKK